MATVSEAYNAAFGHYRNGRLAEALAIGRQIVAAEPRHADSWQLLGVIAMHSGQSDAAVEALSKAVALNPNNAEYQNHLGAAYASLEQWDQAEVHFRKSLTLAPQEASVHYNLAALLCVTEDRAGAIQHYRLAIKLAPQMVQAHFNLGNVYREMRDWRTAEACYRSALAVAPNYTKALSSLVTVCAKQNKLKDSEAASLQLLDVQQAAVARNPQDIGAIVGVGAALMGLGRLEEAKQQFRAALAIKPSDEFARYNLGSALINSGEFDQARPLFASLVAQGLGGGDALFRVGLCSQFDGDFEQAIACYDRAIALAENDPEFHYYRATTRLTLGQLEEGWPEYEWRLKTRYAGAEFPLPRWNGEKLGGEGVVVYAEWGFGDTMHMVRYVPMIEARGGTVYLASQPGLIPLLKASGFQRFVPWDTALLPPQCKVQAPILSLPGIFKTNLNTIPATIPYLKADPARIAHWAEELAWMRGFKVGINWYGSKAGTSDLRSIPLTQFEPLLDLDGVSFISLQRGDPTNQLATLASRAKVLDFGEALDAEGGAFMDSAAIVQQLDLVITCDTSMAHLAGALGAPVWVALPRGSEWRWLWDREDSPWYPTMRLFRQKSFGDWRGVFERIREELVKVAAMPAR